MSKPTSIEKSKSSSQEKAWDVLISETEAHLETAKADVKRLTSALMTFRERKAAGDPYPASTQN